MFRHLLENLPPHPKKRMEYSNDWSNFWTTAVQAARASTNDKHPLTGLINRFGTSPGIEEIQKVGGDLYGTLSTNIHHFRGDGIYDVKQDQWDVLPGEILRAIIPQKLPEHAVGDMGVDWEQERERFLHSSTSDNGDMALGNLVLEEEDSQDDSRDAEWETIHSLTSYPT
jgi:hypothetical protein